MYVKSVSLLTKYKNDESGVTAIEYGLIGVAMATLLGVAFSTDGNMIKAIQGAFTTISGHLTTIGK